MDCDYNIWKEKEEESRIAGNQQDLRKNTDWARWAITVAIVFKSQVISKCYWYWCNAETSDISFLLGVILCQELELVGSNQGNCSRSSDALRTNVLSKFGGVSLESFSLIRSTALGWTDTHNTGMDTAGDAVLLLDVDLGQMEVLGVECKVVFNVSLGWSVDEVTSLESLDSLVLRAHLCAVKATNNVWVTSVWLVPSVISSFSWHFLIII